MVTVHGAAVDRQRAHAVPAHVPQRHRLVAFGAHAATLPCRRRAKAPALLAGARVGGGIRGDLDAVVRLQVGRVVLQVACAAVAPLKLRTVLSDAPARMPLAAGQARLAVGPLLDFEGAV
jgi:hypothetical protein